MADQENSSSRSQPCADASALAPPASPRWMVQDKGGMIATFREWADNQMAIHDHGHGIMANSLRDAAFYRADALYEVAAAIEDGRFDPERPLAALQAQKVNHE